MSPPLHCTSVLRKILRAPVCTVTSNRYPPFQRSKVATKRHLQFFLLSAFRFFTFPFILALHSPRPQPRASLSFVNDNPYPHHDREAPAQ